MSSNPQGDMPVNERIEILLMRYVDNDPTLTPQERREAEGLRARHPAYGSAYVFTKEPMRETFEGVTGMSERLAAFAAKLQAIPLPRQAPEKRRGGGIIEDLLARWSTPTWAFAAGLAGIVVAAPFGWMLHDTMRAEDTRIIAHALDSRDALSIALERATSARTTVMGNGAQFKPTATFARKSGGWCRTYQISQKDGLVAEGLACREGDGEWLILLQDHARKADPSRAPAADHDALEGAVTTLRKGNTLNAVEEGKLLEAWARKP